MDNSMDTKEYDNKTEDDLLNLYDQYRTSAKDDFLYPVIYVYNPIQMIKMGFLPTSFNITKNLFAYFLENWSIADLEFWSNSSSKHGILNKILNKLYNEVRWEYRTLETYKAIAIKQSFSLPLMLYAPYLLYSSNRPKTDMSLFKGTLNVIVKRNQIINNKIIIDNEEYNTIPVTRYAEGMSKGLYYNTNYCQCEKTDNFCYNCGKKFGNCKCNTYCITCGKKNDPKYCGTFYYYEPESTTLLAYKTSIQFKNKYEAVENLDSTNQYDDLLSDIDLYTNFELIKNNLLPDNLIITPQKAYDIQMKLNSRKEIINPVDVSNIPRYAGLYFGLYAIEDNLDQPLCLLGEKHGYDIIILTHMVGQYKIVREILDTRNRSESFDKLIYIID